MTKPPFGSHWVHEIKHDGYRLMVRRDGSRIRCLRATAMIGLIASLSIVKAAASFEVHSLIDDEAVICPRRRDAGLSCTAE